MTRKQRQAIDKTIEVLQKEYWEDAGHSWDPNTCPLCKTFRPDIDENNDCLECPLAEFEVSPDCKGCSKIAAIVIGEGCDTQDELALYIGGLESLKRQI